MKKMNKKSIIIFAIFILLTVGLLIYFRPLPLADLLFDDNTILVCQNVVGIKDGIPNIDSQSNENITEQQKKEILELFNGYTYRRKINTVLSDGSFSNNSGVTYLYVYIYDGTILKNTIVFTDYGEIAVNNKNYRLEESNDLINRIQVILKK